MAFLLRTPTPGARGIDTNTRIPPAVAQSIAAWRDPADGTSLEFVLRYLPFARTDHPDVAIADGDLTAGELADLTANGLLVGLVQHVRFSPWSPGLTRGNADGIAAVTRARVCGAADGATIFYDMEGPGPSPNLAQAIIDYDGAWATVVERSGFVPGGYFGYGVPLTAEQMWRLKVKRYWRAGGSAPPDPANCGYCLRQLMPFNQSVCGLRVDFDVVQPDALGRLPGFTAAV